MNLFWCAYYFEAVYSKGANRPSFFFMSIPRCTLRAFLCVRVRVPKGLPTAQFDFSKDFQLVSGEVRTRMACHFGGLGFANDRQAIRIIF